MNMLIISEWPLIQPLINKAHYKHKPTLLYSGVREIFQPKVNKGVFTKCHIVFVELDIWPPRFNLSGNLIRLLVTENIKRKYQQKL